MKKIFLCVLILFSSITAYTQGYTNENDEWVDFNDATELSDAPTTLETGWYQIYYHSVSVENDITINGDVKLLLCYEGNLSANKIVINQGSSLTIYNGGFGEMNCSEISVNGTLNIIGGNIKINGAGITGAGEIIIKNGIIDATNSTNNNGCIGSEEATVSILGGQVSTNTIAADNLTLSWNKPNDKINAKKIIASSISILSPKVFVVDERIFKGELTKEEIQTISNTGNIYLCPPAIPIPSDLKFPNAKQNLIYNGEEQELLDLSDYTFPNIEGGELWFSIGINDLTKNPTGKFAGEYPIYYTIKSNDENVFLTYSSESEFTTVVIDEPQHFDEIYFSYTIINEDKKYVEISYLNPSDNLYSLTSLEIPTQTIFNGETYTITQISDYAFSSLNQYPDIKTITFSGNDNHLEKIGSNAFARNSNLTSIDMSNCSELKEIDREAFIGCSKLETVTFNEGLQKIGISAFQSCNISSIEFPSTLQTIGDSAFHRQSYTTLETDNRSLQIKCKSVIAPDFGQESKNNMGEPFPFSHIEEPLTFPAQSFGYDILWIKKRTQREDCGAYVKRCNNNFKNTAANEYSFIKEYDGQDISTIADNKGNLCGYPIKINEDYNITSVQFGNKTEKGEWKGSAEAGTYNSVKVEIANSRQFEISGSILKEATITQKDISNELLRLISTTKTYDGGTWVTLKNGKPIASGSPTDGFVNYVTLADNVVFSFRRAEYNSKNASDASSITINGYIINNSNYSFPENGITITEGVKITPKQLKVVANFPDNFSIVKDYDGTIQIPEGINLLDLFSLSKQGIVNDDEVSIKEISAEYENATPGASKKIVFKFTISNSNYVVKDTTFAIGEIKATNIIITEAGVTQVDTKEQYCAETYGNNIQLKFEVVEGKPLFYKIYDIPGISSDLKQVTEDDQQKDSYIINIGVMSDVKPGQYEGKIDFFADENGTRRQNEKPYEFTLTVYLPKNIIKQLYHNVIFVDNHDTLFTAYQWYKNDQPLKGETKQYITERPELTGIYSVEVTTQNGIKLHSCPTKSFATTKLSPTVTPYPNPAKAGVPFTLKLIGGVPENASIMIFNNAGAQVMRIDNVNEYTTITLPRGFYSGVLIYDGQKSGFKIIVE